MLGSFTTVKITFSPNVTESEVTNPAGNSIKRILTFALSCLGGAVLIGAILTTSSTRVRVRVRVNTNIPFRTVTCPYITITVKSFYFYFFIAKNVPEGIPCHALPCRELIQPTKARKCTFLYLFFKYNACTSKKLKFLNVCSSNADKLSKHIFTSKFS